MYPEVVDKTGGLYQLIKARERSCPGADAIIEPDGRVYHYRDVMTMVDSGVESLAALGLHRGSRIAVVLPQCADLGLIFLTLASGACFVPLNPAYTEQDFSYYLKEMRICALLTLERGLLQAKSAAKQSDVAVIYYQLEGQQLVFKAASSNAIRPSMPGARCSSQEDVAVLLHTSGSTARPKIVPITQRQIMASAGSIVSSLTLTADDRCLNMMPLFHIGALVDLIVGPLLAGGSTIICRDTELASFEQAVLELHPSWYQGVPTTLHSIVRSKVAGQANSLRFIRSVSAPLPERLLREVESVFAVPVIEIYGMTETAGVICSNPFPPAERKVGSVGVAVDLDVNVLDEMGNAAGAGIEGEVIVRGDSVIGAYEGDKSLNSNQFFSNWFRTGDMGYMDSEGYLFLTGRKKELINRGGEKISPAEIDRQLGYHPAVLDVGTFAVPHPTLGEEVNAAVVVRTGESVTEPELLEFLQTKIAEFKIPRRIHFVDSLPRNAAGKLIRAYLLHLCLPEDSAPQATHVQPRSDLARNLADMWQGLLGVSRVGMTDNFFELGGDSLSATTFIVELQARLGEDVFVPSLYDSPTIEQIEQEILQHSDNNSRDFVSSLAGLDPDVYWEVRRAVAAVKGHRRTLDSLIVGINGMGSKPPIFLSTGMGRRMLREIFGSDQPIYWMRSLLDMDCRSPGNTLALSRYYAREILRIQPDGEFILGGYCEGAKVAFEVARELRKAERKVTLLFMIEQFVPKEYDGRVSLFFAENSRFYPYKNFSKPEQGWKKYYRGELAASLFPWEHLAFLERPVFAQLVDQINKDIAAALNERPIRGNLDIDIDSDSQGGQLFDAGHRILTLKVKAPIVCRPGGSCSLKIEVTNNSEVDWLPYEQSGLSLIGRWIDSEDRILPISAILKLKDTLRAGKTGKYKLTIRTPVIAGSWRLDVDMAEDNVCCFQDVTYRQFLRPVYVYTLKDFLPRLARLFRT